jgi:hypothetical protein
VSGEEGRRVPAAAQRRGALRWALGAEKHGANNWKRSLDTEEHAAEFCREAFNHMIEHALKMVAGSHPDDDHIGAIRWATDVLAHVEALFGKKWTELKP